jgi:tetratricopeptide (TPR) repeat protein
MIRRYEVLLLCILTGSVFAQTPEALFGAGRQAMSQGDPAKAVEFFEKAVKLRPSAAEYHYWLGSSYGNAAARGSNPFKQASLAKKSRAALERAVELDPNYIDARLALVDFYMMAPGIMGGSESKASEQVAAVRRLDPLAGHRALSRFYSHQKKSDLARNEMIAAVREQPSSPRARYYYGIFLLNEKNYKAALEQFEAAIKLDPGYMLAFFRVGQSSALAETSYDRGEEALKRYLAHKPTLDEPSHARAWYWLGQTYEKQGRKAQARESYEAARRLTPNAKDVNEALKRVS